MASSSASPREVTQLLVAWSSGDQSALDRLIPMVYDELHRLAHRYMRRENPGHSLQTTALVNEAFLRLTEGKPVNWQNRAHFFAVSANVMRRILVDIANAHGAQKRGGRLQHVPLDDALVISEDREADLVALDDALNALAKVDERKSRVVELRFFGGLSVEETAEVLQVSPDTVLRDWRLAKSWLMRELTGKNPNEA
ncbi:MAG TPA: sigma-70 family RNA polymerase sigma factor [Blastocatellia bacterium]|nr:sigma-70 family RNA polymerase sigma factor [Blastocatellia bacterium]